MLILQPSCLKIACSPMVQHNYLLYSFQEIPLQLEWTYIMHLLKRCSWNLGNVDLLWVLWLVAGQKHQPLTGNFLHIRGAFRLFCTGILNWCRLLKIQYVIAIHLMRWLTNFYDFSFKWTPTAAIGIHPTKAWLSQLVNFKNAIWHFRRTICNKILF